MDSTQVLGRLASGEVVVDRYRSHLHAGVVELLPEVLAQVSTNGRAFVVETVDLGRRVGETICVATGPGDEIVYAQRPNRMGLTRFVKDREPEPSSEVTVVLKAADNEPGFVCLTAFVGGQSEREPWDRDATERSVAFWSSHALVWGGEQVIAGTETSACPW